MSVVTTATKPATGQVQVVVKAVAVRCAWCGDVASPGTDFCTPECQGRYDQAELLDSGYLMTLHGHPAR